MCRVGTVSGSRFIDRSSTVACLFVSVLILPCSPKCFCGAIASFDAGVNG